MNTEHDDGAEQAAKLNALLDKIAEMLIQQGQRLAALEGVVQGQQELLRMANEVLRGHQAVLTAHGLDAAKSPQPQPSPRRGLN